jgi:hypothetical protein
LEEIPNGHKPIKMQSGEFRKRRYTSMGKLEEKSDGYYILEVTVGCVTIKKALMDADKPMEEISTEPKTDGFYLNIPDTK